jgi:hypothetical protein
MAIKSVFKDAGRPQTAESHYDPKDNRITARISETWIVQTDNKTYQPIDIFGATDGTTTLPSAGGAYALGTSGTIAICDHVAPAVSKESPFAFEVDVQYYVWTLPSSTKKLSLGSVAYPQNCYFDKDNNAIVNSAGQTFDPSLTKTYYDLKFTLSYQSFTTPPVSTIQAAVGKVNSDGVTLAAGGWSQAFTARQLKLDEATCDFEYQGSQYLWTVSTSWIARSDTFVDKILDQGYAILDGSNNLQSILDSNGNPLNSPVQLDGSGHVLAFGDSPVYLTFKVEDETAMSSIVSAII